MSEPAQRPATRRKRRLGVAVVSDGHLGTYGCHAPELLRYLKSIRPNVLVLNGDIVDIWQLSNNYRPASHMRAVRYLAGLAVKNRVKSAVGVVSDFEQTATSIAADKGYRYVACGHIHQPAIRTLATAQGEITYLNSGHWVENLTALEYTTAAGWALYRYADDPHMPPPGAATEPPETDDLAADAGSAALLEELLAEFKLK